MADRQVTASGKDKDGDITKLCKAGETWSPRPKADAIRDIENGLHTSVVPQPGTTRAPVTVVDRPTGSYRRTTGTNSWKDNPDDHPDC